MSSDRLLLISTDDPTLAGEFLRGDDTALVEALLLSISLDLIGTGDLDIIDDECCDLIGDLEQYFSGDRS